MIRVLLLTLALICLPWAGLLAQTAEQASKIIGFGLLTVLDQRNAKMVGFVVLRTGGQPETAATSSGAIHLGTLGID